MKKVKDISTGEVKRGNVENILISHGIGSCIVVAAINLKKHIGALAHVMLPGKAPEKEHQNKTKYAVDAIEKLLQLLEINIDDTSQLRVCLVGAGNVLKDADETICTSNIHSLTTLLNDLGIKISATSLGGHLRRTVRFDIETGEVHFTEGDSELILLKRWH
jgi:chemotaxis protein CheD